MHDENQKAQPLRELEWLAQYFREHGREDLAKDIFRQLMLLRRRAQNSLNDGSQIIDFKDRKKKKSGEF